MPREEKSKFECEEKKFNLLLKVVFLRPKHPRTSLFRNKLNFFPLHSNFDFPSQGRMTISDCCISLKGIKKNGCVGSCGYAPASVKCLLALPSNFLPLNLKQTFLPIIWIFNEGDEKKFSLLYERHYKPQLVYFLPNYQWGS